MPKTPLSSGPSPIDWRAVLGLRPYIDMSGGYVVASEAEIARESMRASEIQILGGVCYALRKGVIYASEDLTGGVGLE